MKKQRIQIRLKQKLIHNPFCMLIILLLFMGFLLMIYYSPNLIPSQPLKIKAKLNNNNELSPLEQLVKLQQGILENENRKSEQDFLRETNSILLELQSNQAAPNPIKTPLIDNRNYRSFTLANQLKVLLIQDAEAQTAQAALNVYAGSWQDPDNFLGLAHFLEHMLFQGTYKYPGESYFSELVAKYGGYNNAYTSSVKTNYYFQVTNDGLYSVLDVNCCYYTNYQKAFSHFFIDPLLTEEAVSKEVNAVNSEYEMNISEDGWKVFHMILLLSSSHHPSSRFTIGNLGTLNKRDVRTALREFFESHYSANLMALVIKSSGNLNELENWVKKSDFTRIINRRIEVPDYSLLDPPIRQLPMWSKYKINQNMKSVMFLYQIPISDDLHYQTKPLQLVTELLQSQHDRGLYDYLLKQDLGYRVFAATFLDTNNAFTFFLVEVLLNDTPTDSQVIRIATALTSYFSLMRTKPLRELWNEKARMGQATFDYQEDSSILNDVFKISHNLNVLPKNEVFSGTQLWTVYYLKYDATIIDKFLSYLVNPSNMAILVGDSTYQNLESKSALYRLEYSSNRVSASVLAQIRSNSIILELPKVNTYVPSNLNLKSLCQANLSPMILLQQPPMFYGSREECLRNEQQYETYFKLPTILRQDMDGKLWWRLERSFKAPKVFVGIRIESAYLADNQTKELLLRMLDYYLYESLREQISMGQQAGYQLDSYTDYRGITLTLEGWSDHFDAFFKTVIQEVRVQTKSTRKEQGK